MLLSEFWVKFLRELFLANVLILSLLKALENLWFSNIFRGYEMETLVVNELTQYESLHWIKIDDKWMKTWKFRLNLNRIGNRVYIKSMTSQL